MKKFLKVLFILLIPFGWLLLIFFEREKVFNLRRHIIGKVARFTHALIPQQRR